MKLPINQVLCGDCLEVMQDFPDESIDLVITSPPYNVDKNYGAGSPSDLKPFDEYHDFAHNVVKQITRLLIHGGRFCIELGGSGRNFPLSWCWQDVAFNCGLRLFSELTLTHRMSNPTAWGSWLKADRVYTIPNFHMAYVFYKNTDVKKGGVTTIKASEFKEWARGRWNINYHNKTSHPAEFPEELVERFLKLFGHESDVVLDPMCGSGTTCVVAQKLGRKWIGIDINPDYVDMAKQRLRKECSQKLTEWT